MAETNGPAAETRSLYYQHAKSVPLASRISNHIRKKTFRKFLDKFEPTEATYVLDVGVTSDSLQAESNYFEKMYPYPNRIVCVGTEGGSHLTKEYPGLRYEQVTAGQPLPFKDDTFDVVFSNAVLEHVGSGKQQAAFLREIMRVGKAFFVTTPNRWFPVEHHTGVPLLHFLPTSIFRAIMRHTRYKYWSLESHLNILTADELLRLFPSDVTVSIETVRFLGLGSNLIASGKSRLR